MKGILFSLTLIWALASAGYGQFNTGDKFVGGSTSLTTGFSTQQDKTDNYSGDPTKTFHLGMNVKGGYLLGLEGMLQYAWMKESPSGDNPDNNRHIQGGLNLLFGITVYFSEL